MNLMRPMGLVLALSALGPAMVLAQAYPDKPVRLIVPFPPGGTADIMARVVSDRMGQELGMSVVVENKAGGAGGSVGTLEIARAAPDGYTIGIATVGTMGTSPAVTPTLKYDPLKDFAYITNLATMPMLLAAGPSVEQQDFESFLAYARANPGTVSYATGGVGGVAHLMGELFGRSRLMGFLGWPSRT